MIRVVLADDQAVVRDGLRVILESFPDLMVVGEATNGTEAVRLARTEQPDVVVMDVRMPGLDGISATSELVNTSSPRPKVLILTVFGEESYVYEALRAGASGFLLKDASRQELAEAIRHVVSGDQVLSPRVTRTIIEHYVRRRRTDGGTPALFAGLTPRELEITTLVANGLSNADIANRLHLGLGTVKTHVASILNKLNVRDRVQVVVLAYEQGLIEPNTTAEL